MAAGKYLADGYSHSETVGQSVYVGANTKCSADGVTNENVFGYSTTGNGSNSVTLGNNGITKTILKGKVGIGTTSPNERLEIAGNGRAFFGDGGGSSRKGLLIDGIQGNTAARLEAYDYGSNTGLDLVMNTVGGGNVGIGTTDPGYLLEVNGYAGKPGGGSWSNSSDIRLKDITGDYNAGLEEIVALRPVTFSYKDNNPRSLPTDEEYVGFIAQEVQEVFPEAVNEGPDGYLDFNMHPVNVAVVNAIKELKAENEALKTENRALRQDIKQIKAVLGL